MTGYQLKVSRCTRNDISVLVFMQLSSQRRRGRYCGPPPERIFGVFFPISSSLLQKSFSPFDTSGRTGFCSCNVLNFRPW